MEKSRSISVVEANMGWSDLGAWNALNEVLAPDADGNSIAGDVILLGSSNFSVRTTGPVAAAVGLENMTIVATEDAALILPKGGSARIADILAVLKQRQCQTLD